MPERVGRVHEQAERPPVCVERGRLVGVALVAVAHERLPLEVLLVMRAQVGSSSRKRITGGTCKRGASCPT